MPCAHLKPVVDQEWQSLDLETMTSNSTVTPESGFLVKGEAKEGGGEEMGADLVASNDSKVGGDSSFSSSTDGLVLYDLTDTPYGPPFKEFSPHCVKTLMAFRLLNVGYERRRLTFNDIRTRLRAVIGDGSGAVTVPTLELRDGRHLTDSWTIAVHVAAVHEHGARLFPNGTVSRSFAASLNTFCKTSLAPHLGPLTRPAVYDVLVDDESKSYFEQSKVGKRKLDGFRAFNAEQRQAHVQACAAALEVVRSALAAVQESRDKSSRTVSGTHSAYTPLYLEGGQEPTHADFVVYGWYVYTRVAGVAVTRSIWHSFPLVSRWIDDLNQFAGPEITKDFC